MNKPRPSHILGPDILEIVRKYYIAQAINHFNEQK